MAPSVAPGRVTPANDNAEAIEFELAGLSAVASTLDTGVTKFDLQLTVTEGLTVSAGSAVMHDFAGAGLGEGPAPAGIRPGFARIAYLFDESTTADYAHRFTRFLRAIIDGPWLAAPARPLLAAAESAVDPEGNS
ncbi:hypothetical protein [Nocardia sp. NPDC049149]|uniref:hypothetical protein n=1 Tax=Nocardia sp. NPDC049149 TaxID=3364315 RepID=UPI003723D97A